MYLHVDTGHVPPTVELRDPDDLTSLKAVVSVPPHVWLDPTDLAELAGRSDDEAWRSRLTRMLAYAGTKGWLDESGRVRAHVEVNTDEDAGPERRRPRER